MNQAVFAVIQSVQESLIAIREEDELITRIMETTASVQDLAPHFRMLQHYVSRLRPILNAFEVETIKEMSGISEESNETASGE